MAGLASTRRPCGGGRQLRGRQGGGQGGKGQLSSCPDTHHESPLGQWVAENGRQVREVHAGVMVRHLRREERVKGAAREGARPATLQVCWLQPWAPSTHSAAPRSRPWDPPPVAAISFFSVVCRVPAVQEAAALGANQPLRGRGVTPRQAANRPQPSHPEAILLAELCKGLAMVQAPSSGESQHFRRWQGKGGLNQGPRAVLGGGSSPRGCSPLQLAAPTAGRLAG